MKCMPTNLVAQPQSTIKCQPFTALFFMAVYLKPELLLLLKIFAFLYIGKGEKNKAGLIENESKHECMCTHGMYDIHDKEYKIRWICVFKGSQQQMF